MIRGADYNDHHTRVLAKYFLAQTLAVMVGLREAGQPTVRVSQLERNDRRWLRVIRSLEDDGYVQVDDAVEGADPELVITDKIFGEVEVEEYVGQVRAGKPREPLAMWLSNGILKAVVDDLIAGRAHVETGDDGARRIVAKEARVGTFEVFLCRNLSKLAVKYTDLGRSSAQDLSLPSLGGAELREAVPEAIEARTKDLERLKREIDALRALTGAVEGAGGWDGFTAACRCAFEGES